MASKPTIGIAAALEYPDPERPMFKGKTLLFVEQSLCRWVSDGGGVPLLFAAVTGSELRDALGVFDGVLLGGGSDVAPGSYGEEPRAAEWCGDPIRDAYEREVVERCLEMNLPVFGVCRGIQILNVALGGTLYQDLPTDRPEGLVHRDPGPYERNLHPIAIVEGSRLFDLVGSGAGHTVNSVHHQGIKDLASDLVVEAVAPGDGLIEAVRLDDVSRFAAAVQWHPEWAHADDTTHLSSVGFLKDFIDSCRKRRR